MKREGLVRHQSKPREPANQPLKRQLRLELPEGRAESIVDPLAKGQRPGGFFAARIEPFGLGEHRGVPAGGGESEEERGPGRQGAPA